jgi:hypothetical protein
MKAIMTPQLWIGVQVLLDILMVVLLVWFLRSFSRHQASWNEHEAAIKKAESILVEMREISRTLETNLKEKKELSHRILARMDEELKKAEESYDRISALLPKVQDEASGRVDPGDFSTRASVNALTDRGLPKEEIARQLGISVGEVDLIVKLFPKSPKKP